MRTYHGMLYSIYTSPNPTLYIVYRRQSLSNGLCSSAIAFGRLKLFTSLESWRQSSPILVPSRLSCASGWEPGNVAEFYSPPSIFLICTVAVTVTRLNGIVSAQGRGRPQPKFQLVPNQPHPSINRHGNQTACIASPCAQQRPRICGVRDRVRQVVDRYVPDNCQNTIGPSTEHTHTHTRTITHTHTHTYTHHTHTTHKHTCMQTHTHTHRPGNMAKTDMERVGLFTEMGYTTIGDPYVPPNSSECSGTMYQGLNN